MPNYHAVEVTPVRGKKYWAKDWEHKMIFVTSDYAIAEHRIIGIKNIDALTGNNIKSARVVPVTITVKEKK